MQFISCIQTAKFLGIQHSLDGACNSWAYKSWAYSNLFIECHSWAYSRNHVTIAFTLYFVLGKCPDMVWYGVTFAHVLTYFSNPRALSKKGMVGMDMVSKLQYSPVKKVRESEALLFRQCSSRLAEYGLTLWVVTILMNDQELHNFFYLILSFTHHVPAMWSK